MREEGFAFAKSLKGSEIDARACLWNYFTDPQQWRFVVASPQAVTLGPMHVYKAIRRLLGKNGGFDFETITMSNVSVISTNHPLYLCVRALIGTGGAVMGGARCTNCMVDGFTLEDAYVYMTK